MTLFTGSALYYLPNLLSASRGLLSFCFLLQSPVARAAAISLALLTDWLDGYLARRYRITSRLGTILDPLMDKIFVLFAAVVFMTEERLSLPALIALISRDLFLCAFALYLNIKGTWSSYRCHAIWWGKVTTVGQMTVLLVLTFNFIPPAFLFAGFIVLGLLTFIELLTGLSNEIKTKKYESFRP